MVILHHFAIALLQRAIINHFAQRFVGKVRINGRGTKADQHRKMVWIARGTGFNNDVGIAA
ncbi:Uncharacterised protein [Vibrio cholerae]|nr:Uncharacterised protein [Vibrio cholerae]